MNSRRRLLPLTLPFLLSPELSAAMGGGGGGPGGGRGDGGGPGGASGMWAPVSLAVFGGLTTSTFLTLIILPSVYTYMDDIHRATSWVFRLVTRSNKRVVEEVEA